MPDVELIPEHRVEGKPLGWHRHHKDTNKDFPVREVLAAPALPTTPKTWKSARSPLDQGQLGSCTGNACCRATAQMPNKLMKYANGTAVHYTETGLAVPLYKLATTLDNVQGSYPPDDTGSTTVAVLSAAKSKGLITEFRWAFKFEEALATLHDIGDLITGIDWYEGFDNPLPSGELKIAGQIRGGHELCIDTVVPSADWDGGGYVEGWNSWGFSWGPIGGRFRFSWATWRKLLEAGGEVGVGIRKVA